MSAQPIHSCDDLLRAMIGFDTVNGNISGRPDAELELALYLESQANQMGFLTQRLPITEPSINLLVSHRVDGDADWLLFESHLDTVSVDGMTIAPFDARVENGRIYGRGSCDTKGSGAAMLWALGKYAKSTIQPNNIAILFTVDEEISKTGVGVFVRDQMSGLDWKPAGVLVGEPTDLRPVVAHNGVVRCTIRTHGVAAHSSDPAKGRSAISMMVKVIEAIESRYIPNLTATHPLTGKAQCSINVIRGGSQDNIIPEVCEIRVDRRLVPGEDPDQVMPAIRNVLSNLYNQDPVLSLSYDDVYTDPPLDPSGSETFARFVERALADMNMPNVSGGAAYGTDASAFTCVGVPAVVLGPGNIAQAHTCDEWLAVEQLHRAVDVYLNLMGQPKDNPSA